MCGICGVINYNKTADIKIIKQMNNTLTHRGPDGEGIYISHDSVCGFGHKRLSIIDVEGSPQPLSNENDSIWISFNGEIYNYYNLRESLIEKGHVFKTDGDTEVLIHLYEEFGYAMLDMINGMFSFAIWDEKEQKLFLARDRIGIKPLYYYYKNQYFLFSSEQKAILTYPEISREVDSEALWNYLTFRSVPAPGTLYENITQLKPGHYLVLDHNKMEIHQYWDIPLKNPLPKEDDEIAIEKTEKMLIKSIKRRMISDVPLGAFLSGGIDSSLIVALMSQLSDEPVKTYTVGFENFKSSETPYARVVSDLYKTDHHELILKEDVFIEYLEELTILRDAPLSEPADIPLYLLSRKANEKVKVLLSGEGSDELFAGYPKYQFDHLNKLFRLIPAPVLNSMIKHMPSKYRKVETALKSMSIKNPPERWSQWFSPFRMEDKIKIYKVPPTGYTSPLEYYFNERSLNVSLNSFLYCDTKVWLPDNLLNRGDRMTMGASIESRVPFLDHELVEYAFSLSDKMKIRGKDRKWIIKQIALKYLPDEIVNRPKVGFDVPLTDWFRGKLKNYCYETICSHDALPSDLISSNFAKAVLDEHVSGKKDNYLAIWTLLGLALWYKLCLKGNTPSEKIKVL